MLIYFNKLGQIKEYLDYDSIARSGTTAFKIYAIFEDIDPSTVQHVYVKLYRPDLMHTTYDFDIEMTLDNNFYFHGESNYLNDGQKYDAYVLNFDDPLLDMPGLWKVVITLRGNNYNVQGLAMVNVQKGI